MYISVMHTSDLMFLLIFAKRLCEKSHPVYLPEV